jgi:hypothetical protein
MQERLSLPRVLIDAPVKGQRKKLLFRDAS